eukprot:41856_1
MYQQLHGILGGNFASEAPPKIDTNNWPTPEKHNLALIKQIFNSNNINDISSHINIKSITRPKYMFDREKIIAIDDTIEYKKGHQYLALLSVAILFLHKIRDIPLHNNPNENKHKLLWNNIITIIIYLIDNGSNINESFVFHERNNTHPDWVMHTPLYLIHLLLLYTEIKNMSFKHENITNLYNYMLRNCSNASQLPQMYTIRVYVDKNNTYQRGFDHRFFGNVFKKIPSKTYIQNLLLRGIQPFKLCTRLKDNDLNERKETVISLNEMKQISGKDFELFSVSIYIYALVKEFQLLHNQLLSILKQFDRVYNIINDIWECVLSYMYQDVMEFCSPKIDLLQLKKSVIKKIAHVKVFEYEQDFEYWLTDVLSDTQVINEIDTSELIKSWNALMDKKIWKCIDILSDIILHRNDFGEYIREHPSIATDIMDNCCNLTVHSTHFIDIYWEVLKHCNSFKNSIYHSKLKFSKFIKYVFYHLNEMNKHCDGDVKLEDDDTGEMKNSFNEIKEVEKSDEDEDDDWNVEDISEENEDIGYYVNDMDKDEIINKCILICNKMYELNGFKAHKKWKLLVDILGQAQCESCVGIIKILVNNSWDINGVIDGLNSKFGWSLAICAEYK